MLAGQHGIEAFLDKLLAGAGDGRQAGVQGCGDLAVAPSFAGYRHKPPCRGSILGADGSLFGVRPCGWTESSWRFDRLAGVLILELRWAEIA